MSRRLTLPDTASVAQPADGGKLHAPSAERNCGPICDLVTLYGPKEGRALELASGTGQHAVALAQACPGLNWQPSDIDPVRRRSIDAYVTDAALPNLASAVEIDATHPGWGATHGGQNLILLINLLHLISEPEAKTLIAEAAQALAPGGTLILYGPFMRAGELTSDGDERFHASLVEQDPEIGYKDDFDVIDWLHAQWLDLAHAIEMPANNLALIAKRGG